MNALRDIPDADIRVGVTPAAHSVLDRAEEVRPSLGANSVEELFGMAAKSAAASRGGDLTSQRSRAVTAAAFLIIAIEAIDKKLKGA